MTGTNELPQGLPVVGANAHNIRLPKQTIDDACERSPSCEGCLEEHIALDNGYDPKAVQQVLDTVYGYIAQIESRVTNPKTPDAVAGES
jgi:hypothetical protein